MTGGRIGLAVAITLIFLVLTAFIFGLSQMGDCFPEPQAMRDCLEAKGTARLFIPIVSAGFYLVSLWLIFRRRKVS